MGATMEATLRQWRGPAHGRLERSKKPLFWFLLFTCMLITNFFCFPTLFLVFTAEDVESTRIWQVSLVILFLLVKIPVNILNHILNAVEI